MPRPPEPLLPAEPAAVRLMNTVWADRIGLHDALTNVDDLRAFLISVDMGTGTTVTLKRVANFRRLRDALRRVAMTVAGVNSEHARAP